MLQLVAQSKLQFKLDSAIARQYKSQCNSGKRIITKDTE